MMLNPENWPCHPFLCLTHRTETDDDTGIARLGLMYVGHPNAVFPVSLYDIPLYGGSMTEAEMLKTKIAYDSVDAVLNDWQVD